MRFRGAEAPARIDVEVLLSHSELDKIDDWRSELRVGTRSDAIRRLIKLGLKASGGDGKSIPINP
jgi:hypothetical protein